MSLLWPLAQAPIYRINFRPQLHLLNRVHTSNNVDATLSSAAKSNVASKFEATFDFVAKNGNNVERIYRKILSCRQSRNKLNMFNLFRLCQMNEICFDIVAKSKQHSTVEKSFNLQVAFDNVASTYCCLEPWTVSSELLGFCFIFSLFFRFWAVRYIKCIFCSWRNKRVH